MNRIEAQTAVRMKRKRSLKAAILQTFITLTIITVGGISTNFYLRSRNAVLELSDDVVREVTDKIILTTTHIYSHILSWIFTMFASVTSLLKTLV